MGLESGAQMTQNIHFAAVVSAIYGNTPIFRQLERKCAVVGPAVHKEKAMESAKERNFNFPSRA